MYKPYDYDEPIDEDDGHRGKPRHQAREDIMSASRGGPKKSSRWVFISRKADIGILLVLFLSTGFGTMWFISNLPFFVEAASNQYHWAKDVYATWGTPSMRWLFINLVVGVIVATSGLLSAFGGDSSAQHTDRSTSGYDKGVSYRGPEPGVIHGDRDSAYNNNASEARFNGPGYESPHYNPYAAEPAKERGLHREGSFDSWNHPDGAHLEERRREDGFHRGRPGPGVERPFARPVDPEVVRAAKPVSRQGSQRRGMPMAPDGGGSMSSRELPREMSHNHRGEVPMSSRELPREMFDGPRGEVPMSREMPPDMAHRESFREEPREMPPRESFREGPRELSPRESFREGPREMSPRESFREGPREMPPRESVREVPREMPPMEESPPPRETPPVSKGIPPPPEPIAVAEEVPPPPEPTQPEPNPSEGVRSTTSFRKEDAIEIISKVYDPIPEFEEVETDSEKFRRLKTDPAIHYVARGDESSPSKPESLHKSHTFTLGRVIRRDQLVDFIEPLSRKLEGIGRKVSHRSSHSESGNLSKELPSPAAGSNSLPAAIEAGGSSAPQPEKHSRRLSVDAIPIIGHHRRLSSESVSSGEGSLPKMTSVPVIPNKFPSVVPKANLPPSPPLRQRSIVYPPALLSQASIAAPEESSRPSSPPIEEAFPPPPPPHLKLTSKKDADASASILSGQELPSFKFLVPPSDSPEPSPAAKPSKKQVEKVSAIEDSKKPPSGRHSRKNSSTHIPSPSSLSAAILEAGGSSSVLEELSLMAKPGKSNAGDERVGEMKEDALLDRQESSSGKDDDLHQQIEDFLARFHENWRLQRQESLARYKKRLSELDDE